MIPEDIDRTPIFLALFREGRLRELRATYHPNKPHLERAKAHFLRARGPDRYEMHLLLRQLWLAEESFPGSEARYLWPKEKKRERDFFVRANFWHSVQDIFLLVLLPAVGLSLFYVVIVCLATFDYLWHSGPMSRVKKLFHRLGGPASKSLED